MSRFLYVGICVISLVTPSSSFGGRPDRQIQDAVAEIASLKRAVAEQDRRIAELQKTVRTLELATATGSAAMPPGPWTAGSWKTPSAWARIKEGMSRAEVVAILGPPTWTETTSDPTLIYRAEVAGTGSVTGSVTLADDRVLHVNPPIF